MSEFDTTAEWGRLPVDITVSRGEPIFPRVDTKQQKQAQPEKAAKPKQKKEKKTTDLVSFADFQKLDLRVARVLTAEPIEGADRLLKLQVDLGSEKRQVVAGIAEHYTPETLVGKQVIVVANFGTRPLSVTSSHTV